MPSSVWTCTKVMCGYASTLTVSSAVIFIEASWSSIARSLDYARELAPLGMTGMLHRSPKMRAALR